MERVILLMKADLKECKEKIAIEKDSVQLAILKEQKKTINRYLHRLEAEVDFEKGMTEL